MSQLSVIFICNLLKLFALKQQIHILMLGLILLLKASGEESLSILSLMLEFSTLVHHPIIHLSLLTAAMRGRRDVGMSNVYVRLSMDVLLYSFFTTTGEMDDTASNIQEIG